MEDFTPTPKFMGLNITPRFAEALGMAQEKQGKGMMSHKAEEAAPEAPSPLPEPIVEIASPVQELEAKVQEDLKKLDTTGYNMLPGASGKRDSDPQPSIIEKIMKKHPELVKSNPSMLEKYEIYLRQVKKMPEEEVDKVMMPLWSTYLRNEKASDNPKEETYKRSLKRTTEADPMVDAITKLSSLVEAMGKPKTVVRDANGKIVGVA